MHVLALEIEVRIPAARSLKDRRQVVRSLVEAPPRRFGVAAAELGDPQSHRRAVLGYAAVSSSPGQVESVIDSVEAFVWSNPGVEVVDSQRWWLERDR